MSKVHYRPIGSSVVCGCYPVPKKTENRHEVTCGNCLRTSVYRGGIPQLAPWRDDVRTKILGMSTEELGREVLARSDGDKPDGTFSTHAYEEYCEYTNAYVNRVKRTCELRKDDGH